MVLLYGVSIVGAFFDLVLHHAESRTAWCDQHGLVCLNLVSEQEHQLLIVGLLKDEVTSCYGDLGGLLNVTLNLTNAVCKPIGQGSILSDDLDLLALDKLAVVGRPTGFNSDQAGLYRETGIAKVQLVRHPVHYDLTRGEVDRESPVEGRGWLDESLNRVRRSSSPIALQAEVLLQEV